MFPNDPYPTQPFKRHNNKKVNKLYTYYSNCTLRTQTIGVTKNVQYRKLALTNQLRKEMLIIL